MARQGRSIEMIKETLREFNGNIVASAERLGMSRNNLHKRLAVVGIDVNDYRPASTQKRAPAAAVRLTATMREELRQAAFDLAYVRRREHTADAVLEEFIREAFEPWLASKKAQPR